MGPFILGFFSINTYSTVNVYFLFLDDFLNLFSNLLFCKLTVYNPCNMQNIYELTAYIIGMASGQE